MALTERLQVILEAVGGPVAGAQFKTLGNDAQKTYAQITKGSKDAEASNTAMGSAVQAAALVGGTAIAVGLVNAVKKGIQSYVDLGTSALQLQRITGGSAQQVSGFSAVLQTLGITSDAATKPLGLLANNIATHSTYFDKAGVSVAHYKDGTTDVIGTLDNLRLKFQETSDATQRDALAKETLGRGYQTLLPYLTATNEQVAEFQRQAVAHGEILSQADIDKAHEFQIQTRELQAGVSQLERDLASGLVPVLTDVAGNFNTIAGKVDGVAKSVGGLGNVLGSTFKTIPGISFLSAGADALSGHFAQAGKDLIPLSGLIPGLSSSSHSAASATDDLGNALDATSQAALVNDSATSQLKQAQDAVTSSAKNLRSAQQSLVSADQAVGKAVEGVTKAQEGLIKAHEGVANAQQNLVDAQQNLNDLLSKGAVDAATVASAEKNLESATRGVASAQQSLADAQANLNTVLAGASPDELTDAQLKLERATIGVAQAQQASAAASAPHAGRNATAEASAQLAVAEAIQQQKEAQEALDATKAKGTAADMNVETAQRQVVAAAQALTDAINNQGDAAQKLRDAQAGDPAFDQKVEQAKRQVAAASISVRDAQWSERDAAQSVRDAQQGVIDAKQRDQDASYNLRDANYALRDAFDSLNSSGDYTIGLMDGLVARYPELASIFGSLASQIGGNIPYDVLTGREPGQGFVLHAAGGYFTQPHAGIVAEAGPEGVIRGGAPEQTASILAALGYGARGGSQAQPVVNHFHFPNYAGSKDDITEAVYRALTKPGGRYSR